MSLYFCFCYPFLPDEEPIDGQSIVNTGSEAGLIFNSFKRMQTYTDYAWDSRLCGYSMKFKLKKSSEKRLNRALLRILLTEQDSQLLETFAD